MMGKDQKSKEARKIENRNLQIWKLVVYWLKLLRRFQERLPWA